MNRIGAVEDCFKYPGRNVIFIRPTQKSAKEQFPESAMSKIIPRSIKDPESGEVITIWKFDKQNGVYIFANGDDPLNPFDGGSRLLLGGITTLADAQDTYQGLEFVSIWWDELTKADWEAVQYLKGSLRDPVYPVKFRAASNPGEKSHKEVKEHFVTPWKKLKNKFPEKFPEDYNTKISWKKKLIDKHTGKEMYQTVAYIPATLDDNPIKTIRDNYLKTLLTLPEHLQKMYREGSWDTYEGKYWDDIDTAKIYIEPNELKEYGIDFEWEKNNMKTYLSMDWGYTDYTAIYWHLETSKGVIVTYHELYVNKMLMEEVANMVEQENKMLKVQPEAIYTPWDLYTNKGTQLKTKSGIVIGEELIDVWRYWSSVPDIKASQDRKMGWANMTAALKTFVEIKESTKDKRKVTKIPKWMILKYECPHLVDQIEATQIDPKNPEDILQGRTDHSVDSTRMFWVAHIIDPKIEEQLNMPQEGTGAWIRYQNRKKYEDSLKERQTSLFDPSW